MEYRQLGRSDVKITPITLGAWAIHRPGVTAALVGARNAAQARENAAAAEFELTDAETRQINDLLEKDFPPGWQKQAE